LGTVGEGQESKKARTTQSTEGNGPFWETPQWTRGGIDLRATPSRGGKNAIRGPRGVTYTPAVPESKLRKEKRHSLETEQKDREGEVEKRVHVRREDWPRNDAVRNAKTDQEKPWGG